MAIPWPLVERKRFKLLSSYQVVSSASAEVLSAPSLTLIKSLMLLAPSASAISRSLPRASIMPCVGKGNTQSLNRAKHQSTTTHEGDSEAAPSTAEAIPVGLRRPSLCFAEAGILEFFDSRIFVHKQGQWGRCCRDCRRL